MMDGFEVYCLKPRSVLAAQYRKDGSNRGLLTQHSLISSRNDSVNLILSTPDGEASVAPGDWIVKADGSFQAYSPAQFAEMFEPVRAGAACIFCAQRFPNIDALRHHSTTCKSHPANKGA